MMGTKRALSEYLNFICFPPAADSAPGFQDRQPPPPGWREPYRMAKLRQTDGQTHAGAVARASLLLHRVLDKDVFSVLQRRARR